MPYVTFYMLSFQDKIDSDLSYNIDFTYKMLQAIY